MFQSIYNIAQKLPYFNFVLCDLRMHEFTKKMERDYLQEHVGGKGLNKESRFRLDTRKKFSAMRIVRLAQRYHVCLTHGSVQVQVG